MATVSRKLGWKNAVSIVSEVVMPRAGISNWLPLCRGTGFLCEWQTPRPPSCPRFHIVTCGHVAQPHVFRKLHGAAEQKYLEQIQSRHVRVQVQLRGDAGEVLVSLQSRRLKYVSELDTEDISILHLDAEGEDELLRRAAMARATLEPMQLCPDAGAVPAGSDVTTPAHVLIQGADLGNNWTAADVAERYYEVMGDLEKRNSQAVTGQDASGVFPPFKMVPAVYRGEMLIADPFVAVALEPAIVVANSGAPMCVDGQVIGMLVRTGDKQGLTPDEFRRRQSGSYVCPPQEIEYFLSSDRERMSIGTPARRIRVLLRRVEQDLRQRVAAQAA
eukprot:TRINITY_DN21491_c0_g1_i1.p1 TRINITY_DN21491_c0_g1~~TRINITY_DN21491_c0_g1_i1.p1  ORF type:complete len:345 (+),score=84.32 TRINITY_DN21491_c0_g1_i1:44-1036(+)